MHLEIKHLDNAGRRKNAAHLAPLVLLPALPDKSNQDSHLLLWIKVGHCEFMLSQTFV